MCLESPNVIFSHRIDRIIVIKNLIIMETLFSTGDIVTGL